MTGSTLKTKASFFFQSFHFAWEGEGSDSAQRLLFFFFLLYLLMEKSSEGLAAGTEMTVA